MRILIMTPSARDPKWGYIRSVEAMEAHVRLNGVNGAPVAQLERITETQCSNLPQGRQNMLDAGMVEGFHYGVMIDDDMEFPRNILDGMFANMRNKEILALGVNAARKDFGALNFTACGLDGKILNGLAQTEPVTKVKDCGLGIMIVDLQVIAAHVPTPHFEILFDKERGGYVGEDRYFTRKLVDNGIDVYVDNVASGTISHIGDFPYSSVTMRHRRTE